MSNPLLEGRYVHVFKSKFGPLGVYATGPGRLCVATVRSAGPLVVAGHETILFVPFSCGRRGWEVDRERVEEAFILSTDGDSPPNHVFLSAYREAERLAGEEFSRLFGDAIAVAFDPDAYNRAFMVLKRLRELAGPGAEAERHGLREELAGLLDRTGVGPKNGFQLAVDRFPSIP